MDTTYYTFVDSPVGSLLLTGKTYLETLDFPAGKTRKDPKADWVHDPTRFKEASDQLKAYFKGELKTFDLDLDLKGTEFQKKVWQALTAIPYGKTTSYGELARQIGNPKASRAVGMANGKNPVAVIIPCHRVIGKNGKLTGFGGGLDTKAYLLDLEKKYTK